jgi:hypothetical protein
MGAGLKVVKNFKLGWNVVSFEAKGFPITVRFYSTSYVYPHYVEICNGEDTLKFYCAPEITEEILNRIELGGAYLEALLAKFALVEKFSWYAKAKRVEQIVKGCRIEELLRALRISIERQTYSRRDLDRINRALRKLIDLNWISQENKEVQKLFWKCLLK